MRKFSQRENRIFMLTITVVLLYATYNGMFKPFKQKMISAKLQTESLERQYSKNLRIIRKAKMITQEYDAYLEEFKQTATNEEVMSSIISEIEATAANLSIQISDLKPMRVKALDFYNHFSVSLKINSELVDIIEFLYVLQDQPHLFDIEELRFVKRTRRKGAVVMTNLVLTKTLVP